MICFLILSYRYYKQIDTLGDIYILDSFGFKANATFKVTFTNVRTPQLYYALLSENDYPFDFLISTRVKSLCQGAPPVPDFKTYVHHGNTYEFSGVITKKSVYIPIIYNCASNTTKVTLDEIFINPSSFLDYRWIGSDWSHFGITIYYTLLFIIWTINWCLHCNSRIKIHYFISASIIFGLLYHVSSYVEFIMLAKDNSATISTIVRICFNVSYISILFITLLLSAKGWCVYRVSLSCKEIFFSVLYALCYTAFNCLLTFANIKSADAVLSIIAVLTIALFIRELIVSINHSRLHFLAYLYIISEAGINPESTPIYAKYRAFIYLKISVVVCCVFVIARIVVTIFVSVLFWVKQFVLDFVLVMMLSFMCFIFRLRSDKSADQYQMIEDGDIDASEPKKLTMSEIQRINVDELKHKAGIDWSHGMKLPASPCILETDEKTRRKLHEEDDISV